MFGPAVCLSVGPAGKPVVVVGRLAVVEWEWRVAVVVGVCVVWE